MVNSLTKLQHAQIQMNEQLNNIFAQGLMQNTLQKKAPGKENEGL
eukprot:CAMPEP_0202965558 /NCGR_PEP_ID=MMETSP1396-20130829/9490_1 /ASSEMBLY_ACC=CAM_ASM_000872 /TAXON_ID= /ORGANISM="Pseudokeronopsis sp., Strain Brazil" /LENGTH=44 /DNA_ID= /DNA_START= /DNA_END= /DNA_ORIENTATION=